MSEKNLYFAFIFEIFCGNRIPGCQFFLSVVESYCSAVSLLFYFWHRVCCHSDLCSSDCNMCFVFFFSGNFEVSFFIISFEQFVYGVSYFSLCFSCLEFVELLDMGLHSFHHIYIFFWYLLQLFFFFLPHFPCLAIAIISIVGAWSCPLGQWCCVGVSLLSVSSYSCSLIFTPALFNLMLIPFSAAFI